MKFPELRARRLRYNEKIRKMVRETFLNIDSFVYPMFVSELVSGKKEVSSMPGIFQLSIDEAVKEAIKIEKLGITSIILFGIPKLKDATGSSAYDENGIIQRAIRAIKENTNLYIITDVCLCEYTDHGHCGIIKDGYVDNDKTLIILSDEALSHVKAGADMVAPSDMMDGRIKAIRDKLDKNGFINIPIMSYSAKYASAFYGPFRDAAESTPQFGDRKTYQMDPSNRLEAIKEAKLDLEEGADILMVKPAMSYLDIISDFKKNFVVPIAAYNVSGEYALVKAAAEKGIINEKEIAREILTSIKRAGADIIITYFAKDIANIL
ncbi:MAG: porphobilinogen synthase [Deferribacterota bacterium]|nr:porphobilinogen synthase [Deferribacterota bacterium]